MLRHNARPNQVLSFNRSVVPWHWQENLNATDTNLVARVAKHKASFAAILAENAADAWSNTGGNAINLSVQHFDDECWGIIGEWAACLAVDDYTKELDCLEIADQLVREVFPLVKETINSLEVNHNDVENSIRFGSNKMKDVIFNTNTFSLLRNTSFFKHINKALDQQKLREIFDESSNGINMPFHPTHEEQTQAFKTALRQTFEGFFIEGNQNIINAVQNFELEQVALASAKACDIIHNP